MRNFSQETSHSKRGRKNLFSALTIAGVSLLSGCLSTNERLSIANLSGIAEVKSVPADVLARTGTTKDNVGIFCLNQVDGVFVEVIDTKKLNSNNVHPANERYTVAIEDINGVASLETTEYGLRSAAAMVKTLCYWAGVGTVPPVA